MKKSCAAIAAFCAASAVAQNVSYAPTHVDCPTSNLIRLSGSPSSNNQSLSEGESAYVTARAATLPAAWAAYFGNVASRSNVSIGDIIGFDPTAANGSDNAYPRLGLSISGGGTRALMFGASLTNAFDSRNSSSMQAGTGGLLQASTYITGLSGGSWFVSALILNGMPQIQNLVFGIDAANGGLQISQNFFAPTVAGLSASDALAQFNAMNIAVLQQKLDAGFPVTQADLWSRSLAYHFSPGTSQTNFLAGAHGANTTFSSIQNLTGFQNHSMPYPIIVMTATQEKNTSSDTFSGDIIPLSNTVYEATPHEFGSFDNNLAAFIPTKYLGTSLNNGAPTNRCVEGFEKADFIYGASSSLFAAYNATQSFAWTSSFSPIYTIVQTINETFAAEQPGQLLDVAAVPNPFFGVNSGVNGNAQADQLGLQDGGNYGNGNPVDPLVVPARNLDIIIVADASADSVANYANGTSLAAFAQRQALLQNGNDYIPELPLEKDLESFSTNNASHPVFFGCDVQATSKYPLFVWIPNSPPLVPSNQTVTNGTTSLLTYTNAQSQAYLDAAFLTATQGYGQNGTADPDWPVCLACAVTRKAAARQNANITSACQACFSRYCWSRSNDNGGGNSGNFAAVVKPSVVAAIGALLLAVFAL